jgi:hypothetical protein
MNLKEVTPFYKMFVSTKLTVLRFAFLIMVLVGFSVKSQAQCGAYQSNDAGYNVDMGTSGWSTWNGSSWPGVSSITAARSGRYYFTQTSTTYTAGSPFYLKSPKINTPQTFSLWVKTSVATVNYSISFSDDNAATWTNITNGVTTLSTTAHPTPFAVSTAIIPAASTTAWQLATITAAFPANVNGYYFRIVDARTSGTAGTLMIDDVSWSSSVASENTIIIPVVNPVAATPTVCNMTIQPGVVYHFYDVGGKSDFYSNGQTNTVYLTPANAGDKIKITFVPANFLMANSPADNLNIYDSTTLGTNPILGSPFSASPGSTTPYVSSLSTDGSMAVKFISNNTYAVTNAASSNDGFELLVECSSSVCPSPVTTPVISAIASTTATMSWTGIATGYEYATTNTNVAPTGAGTYTTATSVSLTGLTPDTFYYGWVRSKCSASSYSPWVHTTGFMTLCAPVSIPYLENFTGLDIVLPTCTSQTPAGDFSTILANGNLAATITGETFFTKPVALSSGTTYKLSYDYSALLGNASFGVYIGTVNDATMIIPANNIATHNNISATTTNSFNITVPTTGYYYIGFYLISTSSSPTTQLVLDNISIDCITPVITPSTTTVCGSNTIVTLTGSVTSGFTWATSAGTLYSDAAATIPYVALTNTTTVYFRTSANATITVTGINGGCSKTATQNITMNSTTWNGTAWSNGTPSSTVQAIFNGNYASNNLVSPGNLNACSVIVQSGTALFKAGHSLIVQSTVVVSGGTLTFEDTASLVQVANVTNGVGVVNGGNSGNITYLRNTAPMTLYDYTYWSSPVSPQTLSALSPSTPTSRYYSYNATTSAWTSVPASTNMTAGTGYIVRAPSTFSTVTPQVYNGSFSGVPNSGSITTPIVGANKYNLIGNPYPSAINADLFLSNAANNTVVDATIYLWTHNTPITNNVYTANDYAVYNYLGGTGTTAAPNSGLNTSVPNGKIASGQSFFIKGLTSGNATFLNSMRVTGSNNQFFKTSNTNTINNGIAGRIWLDISNDQGAYKQALIGYAQQASLGLDRGYDGEYFNFGGGISLYSIAATTNLAIQGRPTPFSNTDEVPLGFSVAAAGTFTINLSNVDGLFTSQNIYLKDKLLNTTVNLKQGAYTFTSDLGVFNDRFVVVYRNKIRNTYNTLTPQHLEEN